VILFLDNDVNRAAIAYQRATEERRENTIWCNTAQGAIRTFQEFEISEAHLEHDLEGPQHLDSRYHNSGMEVVRWLIRSSASDPRLSKIRYIVHSHNVRAAVRMVERLGEAGLDAHYIPFGSTRPLSISTSHVRAS